jgi:hypothetical protein
VVVRSGEKGRRGGGGGKKISLRTVTPGDLKCLLSATRCTKKNAQKLHHDTEKLLRPDMNYTSEDSKSLTG